MKVKVLRLGHSSHEVEVPSGSTIEEALAKAGVPMQGHSLSLNGLSASPSAGLAEMDCIVVVPKIEGGCL